MATVVVEYLHDPPVTDQAMDGYKHELHPCNELRGIVWKMTFLSEDRRHQVCVFEARDAQTVRDAYRSAEVPFVRAWVADWQQ